MAGNKPLGPPRITAARLAVAAGVLVLAAVLLPRASLRRASSGSATIGPDDPRVAGVFQALRQLGLAAALDSLKRQSTHDSLVLRAGHQLAHALGRQAVALGGESHTTMSQCGAVFASGCYHGVVEASMTARMAPEMPSLEHLCAGERDTVRSEAMFECIHGVGHGVLGAEQGDVWRALHDCDDLSSDALRTSCHEGVFMEAIASSLPGESRGHHHGRHAGHGGLEISPADPYSPCRSFDGAYGQACWLFQGFLILRRVGFGAGQALDVCNRAPSEWVARCYQSIGHQLTGLSQRDHRWVIEQCQSGRPTLGAQCAAGAVLALLAEDGTGARARSFCEQVPASWQELCRTAYAARMAALHSRGR